MIISNFGMGVLHVKVKYWRIFCDVISLLALVFRSTGPIAVARRRSVGQSVGPSVRPSVNTCNSATNFRIFFKISGNIPWVNISRPFFRFCKIFNLEFKKNKFQFKKILKFIFSKTAWWNFFYFSIQLP